jgi:putative transposase
MKYEEGKYYHVFNRGASKGRIFFGPDNYRYCIRLVDKYRREQLVSVFAYCLMPNHYHFLLRQNVDGSISKFLQNIFNSYTQAVNLQQKRSGTLFQGRAKSRLVKNDAVALHLVRYLHMNPVGARLAESPEQWEFSDYRVWCGDVRPVVTDLRLRDAEFSSPALYADFVRGMQEKEERVRLSPFLVGEAL